MPKPLPLDVLIFGGGAAGLWLLDELRRRGFAALLLERHALGTGQTVASQGIIHGGIKYTLGGAVTPSARAIREMPAAWRACLHGRRHPDLTQTRVLAPNCHLWRTTSWKSKLGMVGARVGLRSNVTRVDVDDRPECLRPCPGDVFRVEEQVIDVGSLLRDLSRQHRDQIVRLGEADGWSIATARPGQVESVTLRRDDKVIELRPRTVVLTAGAGNHDLRARLGLPVQAMQRRPLHMVLIRGNLPALYGHCVDGAHTRVTVTSATDSRQRTVWYVGGQVAEDGVDMAPGELIVKAKREIAAVVPGADLDGAEWATYRIDRAEGATPSGRRPEGPTVLREGNVVTAWPTKLALVPELGRMLAERFESPAGICVSTAIPADWPRPDVAEPPWEVVQEWQA